MLSRFKTISKLFSSFPNVYRPSFRFSSVDENQEKPQENVSESSSLSEDKTPKAPKSKWPQPPKRLRNVALVLSGSGVYDGSECTEAVSFMIALSARKIRFQCFAPDKDQAEVVDHLTGQTLDEKRNVLVESARIARGNIKNITELKAEGYDGLFFPGGFGAAKNLSNFASENANLIVDEEVERVLKDFHEGRKPIGLACISPVLAAKVLGSTRKIGVTVGDKGEEWPYSGTIDAIEQLGCKHVSKSASQTHSDIRSLIFTTPAFMKDTSDFSEIFESINNLVDSVQRRLAERQGGEVETKSSGKANDKQVPDSKDEDSD